MFTTTFNVGPSQIHPQTYRDLQSAIQERVAECSHRSQQFTDMSTHAITQVRQFFGIPDDYQVFYTSSATEAMQLAISHLADKKTFHFTAGNWSEVAEKIAQKYGKETDGDRVEWGGANNWEAKAPTDAEVITLVLNDTSTGGQVPDIALQTVRQNHPDALLVVDMVSAAGGRDIDIRLADAWTVSVQKCLGLPAGLGLLILSPRAFEKAVQSSKNQNLGYVNIASMHKKMDGKNQTVMTPNALGIYLFGKQLERWNTAGGIAPLVEQTTKKEALLYEWVQTQSSIRCFVEHEDLRSETVLCIEAEPAVITDLHAKAKESGMVLGKGYGALKDTTIRIANFPGVSEEEIKALIHTLSS